MSASGGINFNTLIVQPQRDALVREYNNMMSAISALSSCYRQEDPGFFLNKSGGSPVYDSVTNSYSHNLSSGSDLAVIGASLDKLSAHIQAIYDQMLLSIDTALDTYGGIAAEYASQLNAINDKLTDLKNARGGNSNE